MYLNKEKLARIQTPKNGCFEQNFSSHFRMTEPKCVASYRNVVRRERTTSEAEKQVGHVTPLLEHAGSHIHTSWFVLAPSANTWTLYGTYAFFDTCRHTLIEER